MTPSDKLREMTDIEQAKRDLAQKWEIDLHRQKILFSDLTALISENYVEKAKYDELVDDYMRLLDQYDALIDNDDDDDIDTDDD